jgi:hypothetical protein
MLWVVGVCRQPRAFQASDRVRGALKSQLAGRSSTSGPTGAKQASFPTEGRAKLGRFGHKDG